MLNILSGDLYTRLYWVITNNRLPDYLVPSCKLKCVNLSVSNIWSHTMELKKWRWEIKNIQLYY